MIGFHIRRETVARWLLGVLTLILVNNVVCRHAHRLPNGTIISHAHPFKPVGKGPYQPNHHTQQELAWLDALDHAPVESATYYVAFTSPTFESVTALFVAPTLRSQARPVTNLSLRGPPVA